METTKSWIARLALPNARRATQHRQHPSTNSHFRQLYNTSTSHVSSRYFAFSNSTTSSLRPLDPSLSLSIRCPFLLALRIPLRLVPRFMVYRLFFVSQLFVSISDYPLDVVPVSACTAMRYSFFRSFPLLRDSNRGANRTFASSAFEPLHSLPLSR